MRAYSYLSGDIRKLDGWTFCADRGDGNGPCLYPTDAVFPGDYPSRVLLVSPVGVAWQLAPLDDADGEHVKALHDAAVKAGLTVYPSAKELSTAQPALADAHLYPTTAVLDKDGKPTGAVQKVPGGKLRVAMCLVGDDAELAADPVATVDAQVKPEPTPIVPLDEEVVP